MSLSPSDWENHRAFLAVLHHHSLSAAARDLGVAQPTIRRRLEALEHSLGQALFTRSPTGLSPTDAARALGPHAEAMATAAAAFERAASADVGVLAGTVRITASEVIGGEVLPAILAELMQRRPDLKFELQLSNQTQDLLRQEADIAVRMVRPTQSALVAKRVGAVKLGLFASPDYLRRQGAPQSADDLAHLCLIGPDRNADELRALAELGEASVLSYRTDSHLGQLAAIRAGVGIGVCQVALAAREPSLVRLLGDVFDWRLETWVVMHEDLRRVRRVRATFDHLVAALTDYCAIG